MQVLKDEVRSKIKASAIEVFKEAGYKGASMREIAALAGLSVGNLYRYYKNKDELFRDLVQPMIDVYEKNRHDMPKMDLTLIGVNLLEHSALMDYLVNVRIEFRDELFILFLRSEGSPFEDAKHELVRFIENVFIAILGTDELREKALLQGNLLLKASAEGIVAALCTILEEAETDQEFIRSAIEYMELVVKPMIRNALMLRDLPYSTRRISDEEIIRAFDRAGSGGCNSGTKSDGTNQ